MSVSTKAIVDYCNNYLNISDFKDYCANGLQIEGARDVRKIITGVSFSQRLIETALKKKAQMIIVHHGLFKDSLSSPPKIVGFMKDRLKLLLENDINLLGYHLPLDAHPVIGNNSSICKLLGIKKRQPCYVGFIGRLDKAEELGSFIKKIDSKLNTKSFVIAAGPKKVKNVVVISGGASGEYTLAKDMGADTFLCGEVKENIVREVEEAGINFINAGHYNTEKLGVKNLGMMIARKFNLKVEFVDIPNQV